jgi:hypothetical protein
VTGYVDLTNPENLPEDVKQEIQRLLAVMSGLRLEQREAVMWALRRTYCEHCGSEQPSGRFSQLCQCWNDE